MMQGYKTYGISVVMVVYAITAALLGKIDPNHATEIILQALGLSALRGGVAKVE